MYSPRTGTHDHAQRANTITADFRSDTVTLPSPGMRKAIAEAELGDDVYGDDPSVNALEAKTASLLGKESGLFLPSGTQSNLAAVMAHCGRGEEFLIGASYHIKLHEAMGTAVLGSIACETLPVEESGGLTVDSIRAAVKGDDSHHPVTRLLSIENTTDGRVLPQDYMESMAAVAQECGLKLHCDGARLMNAAVALGVKPAALVAGCDSVSLCLSKGLGTPAGTVLAGDGETIAKARRIRKMLGGGMRQAGVLAAAGIYALENNIDRLADDHRRAKYIADKIAGFGGITVDPAKVQSNMVFIHIDGGLQPENLAGFLRERGVAINPPDCRGRDSLRLVTHLDIDDGACDLFIDSLAAFCAK